MSVTDFSSTKLVGKLSIDAHRLDDSYNINMLLYDDNTISLIEVNEVLRFLFCNPINPKELRLKYYSNLVSSSNVNSPLEVKARSRRINLALLRRALERSDIVIDNITLNSGFKLNADQYCNRTGNWNQPIILD